MLQTPLGQIEILLGNKQYPYYATKIKNDFGYETFLVTVPKINYLTTNYLYCMLKAKNDLLLIDDVEQDARFFSRTVYELNAAYDITQKLAITTTKIHDFSSLGLEQSFYIKHGLGLLLDTRFNHLDYSFCVSWQADKHLDWLKQQQLFMASCQPLINKI